MKLKDVKRLLVISSCLLNIQFGFSQVDNYAKNVKLSEDSKTMYEKELNANPNSAQPHWNYANVKAKFKHNAYKDAWKYYLKALEVDSINADIYIDFGDFIMNRLEDYESAKLIYKKGLNFNENHSELINRIENVEMAISKANQSGKDYVFVRSSNTSQERRPYSELTDFDRLNKEVTNKKSPYYYSKLLKQYLGDKVLSNYQVYMMLVGYTQTKDYNPYNYVEIEKLYGLNESEEYKKAINKAEELLKTNPLNPTIYTELVYSYKQLKDQDMVMKYRKRREAIFEAMLYSGNGSKEEPYVTFWVKEEYNYVKYLGLLAKGGVDSGIINGIMVDQLYVIDQESKKQGSVHFNIDPLFRRMKMMMSK